MLFFLGPSYTKKNRIDGKVVIITGASSGIGMETALELAKRGAKIYLACRNLKKCEEVRLDIIEKSKNANIYDWQLDLCCLASVQKFAKRFLKEESRLDILINNAGMISPERLVTKDGMEQTFQTNHLGHFLLTNLLLDVLKKSAPSRVVVVSSAAHYFGTIDKEDLQTEHKYSAFRAYSQSKLANVLFTKHLSKMLKDTGVTVNCCHPGMVLTPMQDVYMKNEKKQCLKKVAAPFLNFIMKTPKKGAQTSLKLALDPGLEKTTGKYYADCIPVFTVSINWELAEWLWDMSEELVQRVRVAAQGRRVSFVE